MKGLGAYLERCGLAFDEAVNVLAGGQLHQTVSLRAAIAQRAGLRWGCCLCWLLSLLVQRGHCQLQLSGAGTTPGLVYLRATAAFGVALAAVLALLHRLGELL